MPEQNLTGYPSIDKPWLKYYSEEAINAPLPKCTIYEYLWENNKDHLDDVAIIYFNRKITYRQLFENIKKTANAFRSLGIKCGDIVVIALPNTPESIYCLYALNKIGAIADMIDLRSKGDSLIHYLSESHTRFAIICDMFCNNFFNISDKTKIKKFIVVSPFDSLSAVVRRLMRIKNGKSAMPKNAVLWENFIGDFSTDLLNNTSDEEGKLSDAACILHTSGTTGLSKSVELSNCNFNAMTIQYSYSGMGFNRGDKFLNQVPPFLAYGAVLATHLPLSLGMSIVILPEYRPDKFAKNIQKIKPNHVIAGPADWSNFLESTIYETDFSFLKTLASGADKMQNNIKNTVNDLLQNKNCKSKIVEGYGMTEIGSAACTNVPQHIVDDSVGIPLPLNNFCIYDNEQSQELSYNHIGEICVSGPTVMLGYYNNIENTNKAIRLHDDGIYWLHSGDFGYIDENGNVFIQGRLKRVIVHYDGMKIYPSAIEQVILKHNNVLECCVVGKPDTEHKRGKIPVVFVVTKHPDNNCAEELKHLCKSELSENYLPTKYFVVKKLPLTSNGKVDYRALEKQAEELSNKAESLF